MKNIINKLVWVILLIPGIYLAIVWNSLPEQVPMHYDFNGTVDRYGSKTEMIAVIALMSVVNLFVYFLLTNVHRIDPKKYAADNKDRLKRIAFATVVFITAVCCMMIYNSSHPEMKLGLSLILSAVGLLFTFLGNYMPNLKPNYFAGFRLPWTLENHENWRKTHYLAGRIWFSGGLLMTITSLFFPIKIAFIIFAVITAIITIIPIIYSYRLFKETQHTHEKTSL
jgi:uncharacterized membrane protein